jgi:2-polyprenyl-3-methyl-5-hydroxy-6-metoxy-1,4-benzoquinol methylase
MPHRAVGLSADQELHNRAQREYFEAVHKPTMQPSSSPYVWRQVARMEAVAELQPGVSILEIGAGLGRYSLPLIARGHDLTCLDLSAAMLERLRAAADGRPPAVITGDVARIEELTARRFDRVIGFFMLHHVHDLDAVFAGVARALRPGGIAAFCEPVVHNPLYYLQIAFTPHIRWQAEKGILQLRNPRVFEAFRRAGLEGPESTSFGFFPPFVTNTSGGARLEDALMRLRPLRVLHAFRLFRARLPG